MKTEEVVEMVEQCGGKVDEIGALPDGSGFATASFPLRKDHWLYQPGYNVPPMPMRVGTGPARDKLAEQISAAARYAVRATTMNGAEKDYDPDAWVQNMIVGLLGYWTQDGLSSDLSWANPDVIPDPFPPDKKETKPLSCNRHDDCDEADAKAREEGRYFADHCHDDCCEDCFGS
jgi:hypothetical protein